MTPTEQQTITLYATGIYNNTISLIIILGTGFGVGILGIFIATHMLAAKTWNYSRIGLLTCLIVTFAVLTWCTFGTVILPFTQAQINFLQITPEKQGAVEAKSQITKIKLLPVAYMANWNLTTSMILSDFIVVWRAWVLFQQERYFRVVLLILMIVNVAINIASGILDDIEIQILQSNLSTVLDWLSLVASLVVNLFATGLIAWKAWNHYQAMKEAALQRRTKAQDILLLLIESGALYCTIQVLYAVFTLLNIYGPQNNPRFLLIRTIISSIFVLASTWYPIAVVILINMNRSPVIETFHVNQTVEGPTQND